MNASHKASLKVCVVGTGYVGLVAGTCLAERGHTVECVDIAAEKIAALRRGEIPIYEPGLKEMVKKNVAAGRLRFSTDLGSAVKNAEVVFIAVGTPQNDSGEADLQYVFNVAEDTGKNLNGYKVVVDKSTVPVGTGDKVRELIAKHYEGDFDVVSNPEFLREGCAIRDFLQPDRVVIGANSERAAAVMRELYAPLNAKMLFTDIRSAEMIKYASNAFLAAKISFINEIANLCDRVGADISSVAEGVGLDSRIGPRFLRAGIGYGGSCFPKDVKALLHMAEENGLPLKVVEAAQAANESQWKRALEKLESALGSLQGKKVAVLGLAFKPETDDLREAPSLRLIPALQARGAVVSAVDPVAEGAASPLLPRVQMCDTPYDAVEGADAVLLVTEWKHFLELDFAKVRALMRGNVVVDGRNAWDKKTLREAGFDYQGMGR